MGEGSVRVLGTGVWGTIMSLAPSASSAVDLEWQLFLHHRNQLEDKSFMGTSWAASTNAKSTGGQPLSLLSSSINPVSAYLTALRRQCPAHLALAFDT
jgi:hypothetical protein